MILVLRRDTSIEEIEKVKLNLEWMGFKVASLEHEGKTALAILHGEDKFVQKDQFSKLAPVEEILPFNHPFKLASRQAKSQNTTFTIKGKTIGGPAIAVIAGPCSIESKEQIFTIAEHISSCGGAILRGGAFKPRTSPYSFQGMGEIGLHYLREAAERYNLITISEVMDIDQIDLMAEHVDILQIGARNMQNFNLLKKVGRSKKPIFLKRGFSSTYTDLLMAAEYVLSEGNEHLILCERGIRTFETYSRNTLDLAAVPILKHLSHLPIFVDPSHGTGIRSMVTPMSLAAVAAGADGLMIEIHPEPAKAFSDADQTIDFKEFAQLMEAIRPVAQAVGRSVL